MLGILIGIIPAVVSVWLMGRQQHAEARFQFYRDKANALAAYVASTYQMVEDLGHFGANVGAMGRTISLLPTVDAEPSAEELRARLNNRLANLRERYDTFQEDGTLVLMPESVIVAMREANERVLLLRNIMGTTPDLETYFRSHPREFSNLTIETLRRVDTVRRELQRELGLETSHEPSLPDA